jgi:hypothetical protein
MDWLGEVPGEVGEFFSSGWETVKTETGEIWKSITSTVTEAVTDAVDWLEAVPGRVGDFFSSGWETVKTKTAEGWNSITSAAKQKGSDLVAWVKKLPGMLLNGLGNLGTLLLNAGKAIIQGLIDGIMSKVNQLKSQLSGLKKFIQDHKGPIEVDAVLLKPHGKAIMGGLMKGIDGELPSLLALLLRIEKLIVDSMTSATKKAGAAAKKAAKTSGLGVDGSIYGPYERPNTTSGSSSQKKPTSGLGVDGSIYGPDARPKRGGLVEPEDAKKGGHVTVNIADLHVREEADVVRVAEEVHANTMSRGIPAWAN